jgi:hypothetical protein
VGKLPQRSDWFPHRRLRARRRFLVAVRRRRGRMENDVGRCWTIWFGWEAQFSIWNGSWWLLRKEQFM